MQELKNDEQTSHKGEKGERGVCWSAGCLSMEKKEWPLVNYRQNQQLLRNSSWTHHKDIPSPQN